MSMCHPTKPDNLRGKERFVEIFMPWIWFIKVIIEFINFLEGHSKQKLVVIWYKFRLLIVRDRAMIIQWIVVIVKREGVLFRSHISVGLYGLIVDHWLIGL